MLAHEGPKFHALRFIEEPLGEKERDELERGSSNAHIKDRGLGFPMVSGLRGRFGDKNGGGDGL